MRHVAIVAALAGIAYADRPPEPPPDLPSEPAPPSEPPVQTRPEPPPTLPFAMPTVIPIGSQPRPRLALELEVFGDAQSISRDGPTLNQFTLDRGELGGAFALGRAAGVELRVESIRSAANGGVLGVDGDSIVFRAKRAQVYGTIPLHGAWVGGALGIVADPWIAALEEDYALRPLSATASERLLGWPTGDLAALVRVLYGPARLTVTVGNGEGLSFPERNDGQTTTAVLEGVPFYAPGTRVRVIGMVRDGSVGPARVRDRRFGGGATLTSPYADAGTEIVRAYGIFDRGDAQGWAVAGWGEGHIDRFALAGRAAVLAFDGGGKLSTVGGAIAVEPWRADPRGPDAGGRLRLWLAVDRTSTSGAAMPLPGAEPGNATTVQLIVSATAPYAFP